MIYSKLIFGSDLFASGLCAILSRLLKLVDMLRLINNKWIIWVQKRLKPIEWKKNSVSKYFLSNVKTMDEWNIFACVSLIDWIFRILPCNSIFFIRYWHLFDLQHNLQSFAAQKKGSKILEITWFMTFPRD